MLYVDLGVVWLMLKVVFVCVGFVDVVILFELESLFNVFGIVKYYLVSVWYDL